MGGQRGAPAIEAALEAVKSWHFESTRVRGVPVNDWFEVTVRVVPRDQ